MVVLPYPCYGSWLGPFENTLLCKKFKLNILKSFGLIVASLLVDKGKEQGAKSEGKGKGGKEGAAANPLAGVQRTSCQKWGHEAATCWWKVGAVYAGSFAGLQQQQQELQKLTYTS